jgi:hypothetical protein
MARYQPALLGGLFIGVLSSLPVLNLANCCCLWVILGGMLTVYLDQQNTPMPIETSKAAIGGLLAGAIGGVLSALATVVMMYVAGAGQPEFMTQMAEGMKDAPPEFAEFMQSLMSGPKLSILLFVITVPLYAVFALLGALLGTAFFRKKATPDAPAGPGPLV